MVWVFTRLIRLYQGMSRLFLPKCCRFYPSCSQYMHEALEKHGVRRGLAMGIGRIVRCSPLSPGGYDPVR